jgi:thymidylate kinase
VTGRFIVLEGPDGVGKTALAAHLGQATYVDAVASVASRPLATPGERPLVFVS